jgi:hypothetical protein
MKSFMYGALGVFALVGAVFLASLLGETNTAQVSDAFQATAAAVVAVAAILGLDAFKKQKRYERHVDAAADVMYQLFEFEARFHETRSPFGEPPIDQNEGDVARTNRQWEARGEKLKTMIRQFNELVRAVAKVDLWRADFCEADLQTLRESAVDLKIASESHFGAEIATRPAPAAAPPGPVNEEWTNTRREWLRKTYGTRDDAFGTVVVDAARRMRSACRGLIR